MPRYSLRKAGGSVMVTVPPAYLKRHGLSVGSTVDMDMRGEKLTITPAKSKVSLAEILRSAPKDARSLRATGWDEMPARGIET